ncbi:ATP-binding protein [Streptomyces indonesiensis]
MLPVPHICEAVATVRRRAHALLSEWELPADRLDEALMVISELVTNAILHALPPAVLRLSWTECEGGARPAHRGHRRGPDPRRSAGGRGHRAR